jgi:DnaJ family protein B protein 12
VEDASDQEGSSRKRSRASYEQDQKLLEDLYHLDLNSAPEVVAQQGDVEMLDAPALEEGEGDRQRSNKYTVKQRKAISRARRYGKVKDYYGVLGLEESCTTREVKRKYRELAKLIHEDKTKYPDAKKAAQSL